MLKSNMEVIDRGSQVESENEHENPVLQTKSKNNKGRRFHVNYKKMNWSNGKKGGKSLQFLKFTAIPILFYSAYVYFTLPCAPIINHELAIELLYERLHGQNEAVSMIDSALSASINKKLIIFVGGTGQGKTFAAQIIFESLSLPTEVYLLKENYYTFIERHCMKLRFCANAFIILDNLTLDDVEDSAVLLDEILNKCGYTGILTLLLIYNIENNDLSTIKNYDEAMNKINSFIEHFQLRTFFIPFYDLDNEQLNMCAKDALVQHSLEPNEHNLQRLLDSSNFTNCKQIYSKVSLLV